MGKDRIARRTFLGRSTALAAGLALAGASCAKAIRRKLPPTASIINYNPRMNYRRLGKTGVYVSEVSLGGHWKNRTGGRYWDSFERDEVPEDVAKNRTEIISACIDAGINMVDITTSAECCAYGLALRHRREKFMIAADDHILSIRNPANRAVEKQLFCVDQCLRRLNMNYMDVWRPQVMMDGSNTDDEINVLVETFQKVHEQGKARFLGISSHNRNFLKHIIETFPEFQMIIFPCTAKTKALTAGSPPPKREDVVEIEAGAGGKDLSTSIFDAVKKLNVGVVTIKPFSGGSLFPGSAQFPVLDPGSKEYHDVARLTLQCILVNDAISATVPGMTTVYEVQNNARASYARMASLDWGDAKKFTEAADRMWASLPEEYAWLRDWEWV